MAFSTLCGQKGCGDFMKKGMLCVLSVLILLMGVHSRGFAIQLYAEDKYEAEELSYSAETASVELTENRSLSGGKGVLLKGVPGNGEELYTKGISPCGHIDFTVNVKQRGLYDIRVGVRKGPEFGKIQLEFPDINSMIGEPVNLYAPSEEIDEVKIADQYLDISNSRTFRFAIAGKDEDSGGVNVVIDYIYLKLIGEYVAPAAEIPYFNDEEPKPWSENSAYKWGQVMEGGTGRTLRVVTHPTEQGLMYLTTDMGGMYRWNAENRTWRNMTDIFSETQTHYMGIEAVALAETNPDLVFIACGTDSDKGESFRGEVLKSTDRGETWEYTGNKFLFGSNDPWRSYSSSMQVDPLNENIIMLATIKEGVYLSTNGGETFEEIKNIPSFPEDAVPRTVWFDKSLNDGERTMRIYLSGCNMPLYVSEDGGASWSSVPDSPVDIFQIRGAEDGTLAVSAGTNGLYLYKDGIWDNITPVGCNNVTSVDIASNNPDYIVASWHYGPSGSYNEWVYYTVDGGENWRLINDNLYRAHYIPRVEWGGMFANVTSIQIDPFKPERVYMGGWQNFYMTDNIFGEPSVWTNYCRGIEHGCIHDIMSPTTGARLLVSAYDYNGGRFTDVTQYMDHIEPPKSPNSKIDFMETDSNFFIRVAKGAGLYSTNNGIDWKYFDEFPCSSKSEIAGAVVSAAVHPDTQNPVIMVMALDSAPYITFDLGKTWEESKGIPPMGGGSKWSRAEYLAADRVCPNVFYAIIDGTLYRSDDWGKNFSILVKFSDYNNISTVPECKGNVWVADGSNGLLHSGSMGEIFFPIGEFSYAKDVSFGKAMDGADKPTVFVLGTRENIYGVWRSCDYGKTWSVILNHTDGDDPRSSFFLVEGDRQTAGLCYVGTSGRGIWYGFPADDENIFYTRRNPITVMVNNQTVLFDVAPTMINDRTLVPMRYICEAMGADVDWDEENRKITITRHTTTNYSEWTDEISMQVGSKTIIINGKEEEMDCEPVVIDSRTLVPARFVAQALGARVEWIEEKNVVDIHV